MGARLWHHFAPWHPEPGEALRALQDQFLTATYDLPSLVQAHLRSAREAVRLTEAEGDPYDLLEVYRRDWTFLERVVSRRLPAEPLAQIKLLRRLFAESGQGIGNVLDLRRVSSRCGLYVVRRLTTAEVRKLCKTERPTRQQAKAALPALAHLLDRGEGVYFPVHHAGEAPDGWYFVGSTVD